MNRKDVAVDAGAQVLGAEESDKVRTVAGGKAEKILVEWVDIPDSMGKNKGEKTGTTMIQIEILKRFAYCMFKRFSQYRFDACCWWCKRYWKLFLGNSWDDRLILQLIWLWSVFEPARICQLDGFS